MLDNYSRSCDVCYTEMKKGEKYVAYEIHCDGMNDREFRRYLTNKRLERMRKEVEEAKPVVLRKGRCA